MTRPFIFAICLFGAATGASGQGVFVPPPDSAPRTALTPLQASVARQLAYLGLRDVDVRDLSSGQVAALHHLIYSDRSIGDVRRQAQSVAGRGLFSRHFNRQ